MDDFSFPTIAVEHDSSLCQLPFPHFAASPLWFLPSATDSEKTAHERHTPAEESSKIANLSKKDPESDEHGSPRVADEEKMDLLWEDFNEELSCSLKRRIEKEWRVDAASDASATASESDAERNGMVELRCMRTARLIHHRRPSLLLLLKVLKKLFLIQKTTSSTST
ncbi:uncharacterized protein [Typha latifolia]|uniref:uncharacterized protein n=1 Tax=Typha latifolia TaxID=4733 RepID=UPI003C2D9858